MKRIYYNAKVVWFRNDGTIEETFYERYKKIKYKIKNKHLKVFLFNWDGTTATEEYTNVDRIKIMKFKI